MSSSTGTVVFDDAKLQAVDVVATGNVGIRTSNPQAPLHVVGTDGIIIPSGTTAQQPTGQLGMIRFSTTLGKLQVHSGSAWVTIANNTIAMGGTVTQADGYTIHTFTSSGTFNVYSTSNVEYLIVAGGGGGGSGSGGAGGGAGGMLTGTYTSLPSGTYTITVGDGGAENTQGADSSFNSLTAIGGGYGPYQNQSPRSGGSGGSGGGGSGSGGGGTYSTGGSGTNGQGNNGGRGYLKDFQDGGGGGGGAGAVGGDASSNLGGNGGDGLASSISGTSTYYAGGGGGSSYTGALSSGGNGGGGAGGRGYFISGGVSRQNGTAGTPNTGGGGGGGLSGAAGGSGIIIIRYLT